MLFTYNQLRRLLEPGKSFCFVFRYMYHQINETDQIATHQYDAALRPYIDLVPYHSTSGYETAGMPYNDLVPYQSSRDYDFTSPEYLDVQPDTDTNSSQSDQYEKVD